MNIDTGGVRISSHILSDNTLYIRLGGVRSNKKVRDLLVEVSEQSAINLCIVVYRSDDSESLGFLSCIELLSLQFADGSNHLGSAFILL